MNASIRPYDGDVRFTMRVERKTVINGVEGVLIVDRQISFETFRRTRYGILGNILATEANAMMKEAGIS